MNREDVIYNIKLSFDFYIREIFCKKYGLYKVIDKKYQSVIKNKKYKLEDNVLLLDDEFSTKNTFEITSNGESVFDYVYNANDGTISFNNAHKNVCIKYNVLDIDIVDEYPDGDSNDFANQVISISINDFFTSNFDVVNHIKKWRIPFYIDAFLFSRVLRNKISSSLAVMFNSISIPIFDFINNGPVNIDGTINSDFSFFNSKVSSVDRFGDISVSANDMESFDKKKMYSCTLSGVITVNF